MRPVTASALSAEESPTGASPLLTPACKIDEEGFTSLFNHRSVLSEQIFFELLKGRVVTNNPLINRNDENYGDEQKTAFQGTVEDDDEQKAAFQAKVEKDIQNFVFHMLDEIENVSTSVLLDNKNNIMDNEAKSPDRKKKKNKKKSEAAVSSIFVNYAEEMAKKGVFPPTTGKWEEYPKYPRGCLVTVASRQEVACLNKKSRRVFQGECKNTNTYTTRDGMRQCAGYLWHQLWWFRIVQGLHVEQVYGFVICGPNCRGVRENEAVVSLLALSQCTKIGGKFDLHEYKKTYDVGDPTAFDLLKLFVKSQFEESPASARFTPPKEICPGMMMIPQHLVEDTTGKPWEIVKSGTAALILRLNVNEQNKDDVFKFLEEDLALKKFGQRIIFHCINEELTSKNNNADFYLKIKTLATGMNWDTSQLNRALPSTKYTENLFMTEWQQTYPYHPQILTSGGIFILMRDAGIRLHLLSEKPSFESFCHEFLSLMRGTLMIQQSFNLVHGDIHEGNLLYNAEADNLLKLRLIDWDEAERMPTKRIVKGDTQKERYPEQLREHAEAYTKAQLILLFRDVSEKEYSKFAIVNGEEVQFCDQPPSDGTLSLLDKGKDYVNELYALLERAILRGNNELESIIEERLQQLSIF